MNTLIAILIIILILLLCVIFIPVYVRINTDLNQFEIKQPGILKMSLHPGEPRLFRMKAFGIEIPLSKGKKEEKKKTERKESGRKKPPEAWWPLFKRIIKSFKLNHLTCTIDTNDVVLNAQLVPVMFFINHGAVKTSINFAKRNYLSLELEGHIYRMIWALIRFLIK